MSLSDDLAARLEAVNQVVRRFPTQKAFADALGMSQSRVNKALDPAQTSDRRLAPIEIAIQRKREEEGDDWIEAPENSKALALANGRSFEGRTPARLAAQLREAGFVRIPTVTVEAAAGAGAEVYWEEVNGETWLPSYMVREMFGTVDVNRVKRLRATGTSMVDTIQPGAWVWVVELMPGEEPVHAAIYILRGPFGLQIKRLYFRTDVNEDEEPKYSVIVHSDNPEAGRDRVPLEVFRRDYYVIAHVRHIESPL